jgi:hypothetical protein
VLVPIGMLDTVKKLLEKQTKHGVEFHEFLADESDPMVKTMGFTAHVIKKKTILPCNLKRLTA